MKRTIVALGAALVVWCLSLPGGKLLVVRGVDYLLASRPEAPTWLFFWGCLALTIARTLFVYGTSGVAIGLISPKNARRLGALFGGVVGVLGAMLNSYSFALDAHAAELAVGASPYLVFAVQPLAALLSCLLCAGWASRWIGRVREAREKGDERESPGSATAGERGECVP